MRNNIFIDGYKQSDIVEDCKNFLGKMKELKPYMVEFKENSTQYCKKMALYEEGIFYGSSN